MTCPRQPAVREKSQIRHTHPVWNSRASDVTGSAMAGTVPGVAREIKSGGDTPIGTTCAAKASARV